MADQKKPPLNTAQAPENPELVNLREREKVLTEKVAHLEKVDANDYRQRGFDINEVKRRAQLQLAEVRKAIAKHAK